jgi:hypothetical protein
MDELIRVDDDPEAGVLVPHLHTGSINEHAQFCKSVVVFPFVVMNFEYEH